MEKVLLNQEDIKDELVRMLCDFRDFCDKHKLQYFLCAGTLLGAIRHKDFIPWDDDIDVYMPRPDYDKFIELSNQEIIKVNYKVFKWGDEGFQYPFCKIINYDYEAQEENSIATNYLWIDIFPLDGLPPDEDESAKFLNEIFKYRPLLGRSLARIGRGKNIIRAIGKLPLLLMPKIRTWKYYSTVMYNLGSKYDYETSDYVGLAVWPYGKCERMKKDEMFPPIEVEFRGEKFQGVACYDNYLRNLYDDYMKLPPINKRVNHQMKVYKVN